MSVQLRRPTERVCEQCERVETWDADRGAWQLGQENGEKLVGNPHCIHEWDINGTFNPFE
ncbi:MAG: HEWD family protein [Halobacteriota archaeon]